MGCGAGSALTQHGVLLCFALCWTKPPSIAFHQEIPEGNAEAKVIRYDDKLKIYNCLYSWGPLFSSTKDEDMCASYEVSWHVWGR